ncbi:CACTA en-spm transposon protein [Cucumis melo var. makuwa]|uniref:CACTA en-spm transposon protein n=1 Tax=Cucumis melo var. makuwa TaxID=1194695 RepID=A0A5D3D6H1_CUCMM|nr:CACTA en-spm transposon protein [Cucumis melo var. makuwa]TYK19148.1 CACTA en-spm transposon protein [Cucumis melo var. makuwa]
MGWVEMDDVENEQLNVLKIVIGHRVDEHFKNDTLHYVSFSSCFDEKDAMFLKFIQDLNNLVGGSSSMGDNSSTTKPSPTSRRHAQSRLLKLEHYVHTNRRIQMSSIFLCLISVIKQ